MKKSPKCRGSRVALRNHQRKQQTFGEQPPLHSWDKVDSPNYIVLGLPARHEARLVRVYVFDQNGSKASILAYIMMSTLSSEVGLKLLQWERSLPCLRRVGMCVTRDSVGKGQVGDLEFLTLRNKGVKSNLNFLNNCGMKPSGPWHLPDWNDDKVVRNSSLLNGAFMDWRSCSGISGREEIFHDNLFRDRSANLRFKLYTYRFIIFPECICYVRQAVC